MGLRFRPAPILTGVTIIGLAILISLGTWQYKRLQWKTGLLAEIEAAVTAEPLTSLAEISQAIDAGEYVDFRRVEFTGVIMDGRPFSVYTSENRDVSWRQFFPVVENGYTAFMDLKTVSDAEKDNPTVLWASSRPLAGYIRLARPDNRPRTQSTPDANRWFGFNPMPESHDWSEIVGKDIDTRYYINIEPDVTDASDLPIRRPDIRNNHFDYMLTWYGLALTLLVFYGLIHRREGRLSWH